MRNILIIGASSGIGKETASVLHANHHHVIGTYHKTKSELVLPYSMHPLNVLDETIDLDFLPDSLDGLVYCPGSINLKPFGRITPNDFVKDYELQLVGAIKVIQAVLPRLKKGTNPAIVLFSTAAVQTGFPFHTLVSSSKGAIEGLTKALAAELAPNIRVNCIAPSITDTPLAGIILNTEEKKSSNAQRHPLKRIGAVGDIASTANFLLSETSSWITGQIFHVDGGISTLRV